MSFPQPFFFGHKLIEGQALDEALATPTWSLASSVAATSSTTPDRPAIPSAILTVQGV